MPHGLFLVFEGIEGCSKTTQVQLLSQWMTKHDIPHICWKEPHGEIRELLLNPVYDWCPEAEMLLYAASRIQSYKTKIEPALKKGYVVICDRYLESSLAHQGYALGLDMERVQTIHDMFVQDGRITFLLDIPMHISKMRRTKRGTTDRIELRSDEYHSKVRDAYLKIAETHPYVHVIDATKSPEEIHQHVLELVLPVLRERGFTWTNC